jgi:hypothetical protein
VPAAAKRIVFLQKEWEPQLQQNERAIDSLKVHASAALPVQVLLHLWVVIVLTTYTPEMHAEHAAEQQQHSFTR